MKIVNRVGLLLIYFLAFICQTSVYGQNNKENLYSQREKIQQEINLTAKLLETTKKKKGNNLSDINLLRVKIKKRNKIIDSYEQEIIILNNKVIDRKNNIDKLSKELEKQRKLYGELIQYSYKNHNHYSTAIYLLASKNINQFYLRKKYLEQLKNARKDKIDLIKKIQLKIEDEVVKIENEKLLKAKAIDEIRLEEIKLGKEKIERERIVSVLAGEEKKLHKEIKKKQAIEEEIARKLEELIREEARKSNFAKLTPEQQLVSDNFEKNKGKLPWPTRQGVITERFGVHPHPDIKGIKVRNNGIDISTVEGEQVRCIFSGTVSRIFTIKTGGGYGIIVRHGSYYTTYYNLDKLTVNVGDKVSTKQKLGVVAKAKNGSSPYIQLMVWKGKEKLNPEAWISN